MAGRGVDIKLGGSPEHMAKHELVKLGLQPGMDELRRGARRHARPSSIRRPQAEAEEVRELGGLYIIGTERHESRRIDNQLRGRSGRQGDPGESRFFLSAEDDLIRLFAGERIYKILDRLGPIDEEGNEEALEAKMLTKTIEGAQKKVEQQNFLIRKRVLEYDDVMNEQRRVIYRYRREVLEGKDMSDTSREELVEVVSRMVDEYTPGDVIEDWDLGELQTQVRQLWPSEVDVATLAPETTNREDLRETLVADALAAYDNREQHFGDEIMRQLERAILLQLIDNRWREHLYEMDYLREGIHLRGFAQIDPLVAYKNEGFSMFDGADALDLGGVRPPDLPRRRPDRTGRGPRRGTRPGRWPRRCRRSLQRRVLRRDVRGPALRPEPGCRCDRVRSRRGRRADLRGNRPAPGRKRRPLDGRAGDGRQGRARQDRPQRPLLVRIGQEVQEVPRRLGRRRFS